MNHKPEHPNNDKFEPNSPYTRIIDLINTVASKDPNIKCFDVENLIESSKKLKMEMAPQVGEKLPDKSWIVYNILPRKKDIQLTDIKKSLLAFLGTFWYMNNNNLPTSMFLLFQFNATDFTSIFIHLTPEKLIIRYINPFGEIKHNNYDITIIDSICKFLSDCKVKLKVDLQIIRSNLSSSYHCHVAMCSFLLYWHAFLKQPNSGANINKILDFVNKTSMSQTLKEKLVLPPLNKSSQQKILTPTKYISIQQINTASSKAIANKPIPIIPIPNQNITIGNLIVKNSHNDNKRKLDTNELHDLEIKEEKSQDKKKRTKVESSMVPLNHKSIPIPSNSQPIFNEITFNKILEENNQLRSDNTQLLHELTLEHLDVLLSYTKTLREIPSHKDYWQNAILRAEAVLDCIIKLINYRSIELQFVKSPVNMRNVSWKLTKDNLPEFIEKLYDDIKNLVVNKDNLVYVYSYADPEYKGRIDIILLKIQYLQDQLDQIVNSLDTLAPQELFQHISFKQQPKSPTFFDQSNNVAVSKTDEPPIDSPINDIKPDAEIVEVKKEEVVDEQQSTTLSVEELITISDQFSYNTPPIEYEAIESLFTSIPQEGDLSGVDSPNSVSQEKTNSPLLPEQNETTSTTKQELTPDVSPASPNTELWYTDNEIQQLLRIKLHGQENIEILAAQFPFIREENKESETLCINTMKQAVIKALKQGITSLMPLNTERSISLKAYGLAENAGKHWIGVSIKPGPNDEDVTIKFIDPLGSVAKPKPLSVDGIFEKVPVQTNEDYSFSNLLTTFRKSKRFTLYPNAEDFANLIHKRLVPEVSENFNKKNKLKMIVTGIIQQTNDYDCGPLIVEDLVADALNLALNKEYDSNTIREEHKKLMEENSTISSESTLKR